MTYQLNNNGKYYSAVQISSLCPYRSAQQLLQEGMTDTCPLDGGCWSQYPQSHVTIKMIYMVEPAKGVTQPATASIYNCSINSLRADFIRHTGAL